MLTLEQKYKIAKSEVEFYKSLSAEYARKLISLGYKFTEHDVPKRIDLSTDQKQKLKTWLNTLPKSNKTKDQRIQYQSKPTGVGQYIVAIDSVSGKELDLSEYEKW